MQVDSGRQKETGKETRKLRKKQVIRLNMKRNRSIKGSRGQEFE
jgi:hypothetical protein